MSVVIHRVRDDPTMPTKRLRYVTKTDAGNVIGCGDGPVYVLPDALRAAMRTSFAVFPQDKITKNGANKDAMTKDAVWKDHVKDDGMAKGATKKDETKKSAPFFVYRRVE
jgi:pentapeptide MXKDX repeat protein